MMRVLACVSKSKHTKEFCLSQLLQRQKHGTPEMKATSTTSIRRSQNPLGSRTVLPVPMTTGLLQTQNLEGHRRKHRDPQGKTNGKGTQRIHKEMDVIVGFGGRNSWGQNVTPFGLMRIHKNFSG